MVDVNKLLQLEYLNGFILELDKIISNEEKKIVKQYTLDTIIAMNDDEINILFEKYGLKNENILEFRQSVFLDENWEFAYLYSDDISYSLEQKQKLRAKAKKEVDGLNKKISFENEKIRDKIKALREEFKFINIIIKILSDEGLILDEDIELLKRLIITTPLLEDKDRFKASLIITRYLIETDRKILAKKEVVNTGEFEQMLDEAYDSISYKEGDISEDDLTKLPYFDLTMEYYERYKELFDETGYNDIFELMNDAFSLFSGVDEDVNSISKDDFCIEIAGLLYQLNYMDDDSFVEDAIMKLSRFDKLYESDSKYIKYKKELLKELGNFSALLLSLTEDSIIESEVKNKFGKRIKLLSKELENNFISDIRKNEIDLEFMNIKNFMNNLSGNMKILLAIEEYLLKISSLYSSYNSMNSDYSQKLSNLQDTFLKIKDEIVELGINENISFRLNEHFKQADDIELKLSSLGVSNQSGEKVVLKGFVLFDFDEKNEVYVVGDLNPSIKNKMLDKSIESKKLKKGYEAYSKLVNDLFLLGNTEKLENNDSQGFNTDRLNEPIYWDLSNRDHSNETGMWRIKGERNGVERFIEQRIILHHGTMLYEQIVGIIKEILPNVEFDYSQDVVLYINFASAMKHTDFETYSEAIKRYKRKSPLYMLLIEDKNKERLSDEECDMLREILKMTMNAFNELVEINPNLKFDIIKQISGVKTRG